MLTIHHLKTHPSYKYTHAYAHIGCHISAHVNGVDWRLSASLTGISRLGAFLITTLDTPAFPRHTHATPVLSNLFGMSYYCLHDSFPTSGTTIEGHE